MKRTLLVLCLVFSILSLMSAQDQKKQETGSVWIIPIKGDIEPSISAFIRRAGQNALNKGAGTIIFEIDTFGGRVDTALQISSFIGSLKNIRTVAWVRSGPESMGVSWSAGALIALSCQDIVMSSGTSIGAAAPVTIGADGQMNPTGEKTVSAVRSQMAALAEKNKHPVLLALAMVDQDLEVWEVQVNGQTKLVSGVELEGLEKNSANKVVRLSQISAKGKLLSLTAGEAQKYGLALAIADTSDELVEKLGLSSEIVELVPTAADQVVSFLTSGAVQTLLILLGLVMLFLEINTPGFGIPGVVAIISFVTVFGLNALLGTVGSLELILFLVGVALLAIEIFILPGFGITGISGIVLIGLSLVFSRQDFTIPSLPWQWELFGRNVLFVSVGIVLAIAAIAVIALMGPRIRLFDRLTLKTKIEGTAGGPDPEHAGTSVMEAARVMSEAEENYGDLLGKRGKTITTLRPSGKAEFEGKPYVVEADGAFIEPHKVVEVIRVRGNRIIVRSV
ncbi:MAG: nodulation protein NfeD [Treponema sp.]|nr:nodulation protein NfeD [Treponema sp.]